MGKKEFLFMNLCALTALLLTCVLWNKTWILFLCLFLLSAIMLYRKQESADLGIFLFSAFWGSFSEIIAVYSGAWHYEASFPIPPWLVLVWGIAGVYISSIYSFLRTYFNKNK